MISRTPLFVALLLSVSLLSGCYVDRRPTMTLEERMMASDKELADYERAKAGEAAKNSPREKPVDAQPAPGKAVETATTVETSEPGEHRAIAFAGRRFTAVFRHDENSGKTTVLTVDELLPNRAVRHLATASFATDGETRVVADVTSGLVRVLMKKPGAGDETEIFRYDLNAAAR